MLLAGIRVKMKKKGVEKNEKSVSLLSHLLLSSTLFWGVPMAQGEVLDSGEILRVPAESASYCHMTFPAMREDSLSWAHPGS